ARWRQCPIPSVLLHLQAFQLSRSNSGATPSPPLPLKAFDPGKEPIEVTPVLYPLSRWGSQFALDSRPGHQKTSQIHSPQSLPRPAANDDEDQDEDEIHRRRACTKSLF